MSTDDTPDVPVSENEIATALEAFVEQEALAAMETETGLEAAGAAVKLPQHVEITDAGPCKKHVKVTIERPAIDSRIDEKFSTLMQETPALIPGFRPGKAPRKIVERKFSKEVVGEVKNEILMVSLEQLAEDNLLSPLSPPELDPVAVVIPDSGPMIYEFNIEVRPEFDLPNYKNLKLRRPIHTFSDEEVAKETRRILEPRGQIIPKAGDPPVAEMNDLINAKLSIKGLDGQEIKKLDEVQLKIEKQLALSDGVAENFGQQIAGAKPGETRTVDITLSQDVSNETMRGAKIQSEFTILDVKTVRLPDLTPEILHEFGVRTPEQFNELVRTRLERYLQYIQRQSARQQVFELLAGEANWDLPRDLLVRQARKTLNRKLMEMRGSGMTDAEILGKQRLLEQDAVRSTAAALKEHFVLQKIAELEKIEIEDEDIENEIDIIADRNGESPRRVKARLEKEDLIETLATELLERKALDLVLSTAEYEDFDMNMKEKGKEGVSTVDAQASPESEKTESTPTNS